VISGNEREAVEKFSIALYNRILISILPPCL